MEDKIFKSYDIRGIAGEDLDADDIQRITNAYARINGITDCVVGRDARKTGPQYAQAAIQGLRDAGVDVTDAGVCSTSQLKWACAEDSYSGGVMVTASHNPPPYNGLKIYRESGRPWGKSDGMHEIKEHLDDYKEGGQGSLKQHSYTEAYVKHLTAHHRASDKTVFIDPSGGSACKEVKQLAEAGSYDFVLYNAEEDPEFTEHPPNPLEPEAYTTTQEYCKMHNCIGLVLDGDGDRCFFIDEQGVPVGGDFLAAWLAQHLVETGAVATVNSTRSFKKAIEQTGGSFTTTPVGYVHIQKEMIDDELDVGAEKSGHIFFKETHYAESPLLALLYVLKYADTTLHDAIRPLREEYLASEEHNYEVGDRDAVLAAAKKRLSQEGDIDERDGILCEGSDWWLSVRKSNTEPLVRITWEAQDQERYQELEELGKTLVEPFATATH